MTGSADSGHGGAAKPANLRMVLPIPAAAAALGIAPITLRRWVRQGCPVVRAGHRGRGLKTMVDPDAVRDWRTSPKPASHDDLARRLPGIVATVAVDTAGLIGADASTGRERHMIRLALAAMAQRLVAELEENRSRK